MLARKVYDMTHKKENVKTEEKGRIIPTQKAGVPTLQELARDVVADNFDRYPHLKGVPDKVKAEVWFNDDNRLDNKQDKADSSNSSCSRIH